MVGSETSRVAFAPCSGGGKGRSTPPQLAPASEEKYPRIGRRKISLEPAASVRGCAGLSVIKVSLCGPHSFDTSTLLPTLNDVVGPASVEASVVSSCWYFAHHLGSG